MGKKTIIELLTLRALADRLGLKYGTIRNKVMKLQKESLPMQIENYKLIGEPNRNWYAFNSDKYDVQLVDIAEDSPEGETAQNEPA